MEKPKPQKAAPAIQPTSVLVKANSRSKSPMMSPRMANDMAVATKAMQLAVNNRREAAGASRVAGARVLIASASVTQLGPAATDKLKGVGSHFLERYPSAHRGRESLRRNDSRPQSA